MSTINYLASNRLRTWGHWLSVINRCHDMIDDNYRVWSGYTLEGNRWRNCLNLWSLSNLPPSWQAGIGINSLISLTTYRISLDGITFSILIDNVRALVVGRVGDVDSWVTRLTSYCFGSHTCLTWCVAGKCWNIISWNGSPITSGPVLPSSLMGYQIRATRASQRNGLRG